MATENLYSHVVAWLKILLPLAALAILSSVVFFANEADDTRTIPFATEEGGDDTTGPRINRPEFVGITSDGSAITLNAREVTPIDGSTENLKADAIAGKIQSANGRVIETTAIEGAFDLGANIADLMGEVHVTTSDGLTFVTQGLRARMDAAEASSEGPVAGEAPFGTFEAGSMELSDDKEKGNVLVFKNGVKLIYVPRS